MDYVNGIPALAGSDALNDVPPYTDELRDALLERFSQFQGGTVDISYGGSSTATARVNFAQPYATPPVAVVCYASSMSSPRTITTAYDVDTTGFTAGIQTADGATHSGTRTVAWIAIPT